MLYESGLQYGVLNHSCVMFLVVNRFFKEYSDEEREHAEKLIKYQLWN
ncbi:unnamed protein product [Trifolium pratense]|uniref:Uncharacterized protein n=1 Tax=Trifolium pratense TaxID=57577 RepID=A0ACB0IS60_TRIPR|nr:unnamed protein product [Trifolium pratense]